MSVCTDANCQLKILQTVIANNNHNMQFWIFTLTMPAKYKKQQLHKGKLLESCLMFQCGHY